MEYRKSTIVLKQKFCKSLLTSVVNSESAVGDAEASQKVVYTKTDYKEGRDGDLSRDKSDI